MSDSMTKDDVLSALGEISQHFENCTEATHGSTHERFHRWMNAADWAAAYLNDPAPAIGSWISVKDRLPEDGQEVVAVAINGISEVMIYHTEKGGVWDGEQGWCSTDGIDYWLPLPPLPEPPEEVSGDARQG